MLNVFLFFVFFSFNALTELSDEEQAQELEHKQEQEQEREREHGQEQTLKQEQEQDWEREHRHRGDEAERHSATLDAEHGSKGASNRNIALEDSHQQHHPFREENRQATDGRTDECADEEWSDSSVVENRHYYFKLSSTSDKPNSLVDRSLPFFVPPTLPL